MNIHESDFSAPDPRNPQYSKKIIDFYQYIPPSSGEDNHGLIVRKNLQSGKYEVVATYWRTIRRPEFSKVLFDGELGIALRYADNLYYKFHQNRHDDRVIPALGVK